MRDEQSQTERGFDRFVNFSDAVVAIAISLLILPVVDAVSDTVGDQQSAADFIRDNRDRLFAFGLSFVVIASFWVDHHRLFEQVVGYTRVLLWCNLVWLATIVFLPLPTEILSAVGTPDATARLVYIAAVLAVSVATVLLETVIDRTPEVRREPEVAPPPLGSRLVTPALLAVALVVGVTVEQIGLGAMFLVFLGGPVSRALDRRDQAGPPQVG